MSRRPYWTIGFGLALALGTVPSAQAQFRKAAEPAATETPADATKTETETPKSEAPEGEATKGEATKGEATKGETQANDRRSPFSDPAQQKRMLRAMVTGQGSMGFGGRSSGGLTNLVLRSTALQEELKVTDEQKKQIEDINKQSDDRRTEMMRQMRDSRDEGERNFSSMRDSFRTMGQESQDAALRVLTTEQKQRLNQIALQIEGPTAIAKPEIGRQLNLSPSQQQQIQAIVNQYNATLEQQRQQMGAMFGGRGGPGGGGQPGGRGFAQQGGGPGGGGPGGFGPGGGGPGGGRGFAQAGGGPGGQAGGRGFAQQGGQPGGQTGGRGFAQQGGGPGGFGPGAAATGNRFAQGGPGGQQGGRGQTGAQAAPGGGNQNTDRRQMFAQMQERLKKQAEDEDKLLEQTESRIAKALTVKQRKSFNTLLGETFDLAKLFEGGMNALFGGGGRGGPGGDRGGRGGGRN